MAALSNKRRGENAVHRAPLTFLLCVDNVHLRQGDVVVASEEFDKSISACLGIVIRLHRGSCRAEKRLRTMHLGEDQRNIARIVARCRVLLFVGGLMFLVNNHQTEVGEREKHRAAHSKHNARRGGVEEFLPNIHALVVVEFRVIYN